MAPGARLGLGEVGEEGNCSTPRGHLRGMGLSGLFFSFFYFSPSPLSVWSSLGWLLLFPFSQSSLGDFPLCSAGGNRTGLCFSCPRLQGMTSARGVPASPPSHSLPAPNCSRIWSLMRDYYLSPSVIVPGMAVAVSEQWMHPAGFSQQLAVILEEHPNPLLLQHLQIPALPQGQLSCIPWRHCQVPRSFPWREGSKNRSSDGPRAWILIPIPRATGHIPVSPACD